MRCSIFQCILLSLLWGQGIYSLPYKLRSSETWFPVKKQPLLEELEKHHQFAQKYYDATLQSDKIRAIIVPHAGYKYSGNVASAAYRLIKADDFKRVVILAPCHYQKIDKIALPDKSIHYYKSPLGKIELDQEIIADLEQISSLFEHNQSAHETEHSVNVQIPFIQQYFGEDCKLVPLVTGDLSFEKIIETAAILKDILDEQTLLVISTDLTHYGDSFDYKPFTKDITQKIYQLDSTIVKEIQSKNLQGFREVIGRSGATVCGKIPVMILLALLEQKVFGDVDAHVVAYDTSASDKKNPNHSVSYISVVISNEKVDNLPLQQCLTGYEKKVLLELARNSLQQATDKGNESKPVSSEIAVPGLLTKSMQQTRGAFVTLYKQDAQGKRSLRGCIGNIIGTTPLYQTVHNMTYSAALHDSRFAPVRSHERKDLQIAISALTPARSISSYQAIKLGLDGIILEKNGHSAVFLPKVPLEQGWNLEQTLASLAQKAGLAKNDWKNAKYKVFQSIDFAENKGTGNETNSLDV